MSLFVFKNISDWVSFYFIFWYILL